MKITNNYGKINYYSWTKPKYTSPSFGISFSPKKSLRDIFVKKSPGSESGISKIKRLHPGNFGTECKGSLPLGDFEELFGLKELQNVYKKGISTNTDGWADCFLKSMANTPLSTSSVYDCSVMYLFNKDTNTHFLYHSYYKTYKDTFDSIIKNFMPEGFTKAVILPGQNRWVSSHEITLPEMLKAIKLNNKNAPINIRHYASPLPEVVGYKGDLYEIPNMRVSLGFSDKGQASFPICDIRVSGVIEAIEHSAVTLEQLTKQRKVYNIENLDAEILKVLNNMIDKYQKEIERISSCKTLNELETLTESYNEKELSTFLRAIENQKQKITKVY